MTLKYLLLGISLVSVAVVSQPLVPSAQNWFAPLVSNDLATIKLSSRPRSHVLHNEFLRLITTSFTIGMFCAPSYYEILEQPALVYYDENGTQQQTTESEFKCMLHNLDLEVHPTTLNCTAENTVTMQYGHVNTLTNESFVIFQSCEDKENDTTIFMQSRLHRWSSDGEQLPLAASSLSVHQSDAIGHQSFDELTQQFAIEVFGDFECKIEADKVSGSSWRTDGPLVRSYDTWKRYLWNGHKLGLGYLVGAAPRISARLVPVVESIRTKASDRSSELYTGYLGKMQVPAFGETGDKLIEVPKYVWFLVSTAEDKAILYVVPNGGHAVDENLGENRCDQSVNCYEIGNFVRLNLGIDFTAKYSLL